MDWLGESLYTTTLTALSIWWNSRLTGAMLPSVLSAQAAIRSYCDEVGLYVTVACRGSVDGVQEMPLADAGPDIARKSYRLALGSQKRAGEYDQALPS